jgi:hypothetical protein
MRIKSKNEMKLDVKSVKRSFSVILKANDG